MAIGLFVFLLLMLMAVFVLYNLYATSVITSAGHEAVAAVAAYSQASNRCAAVSAAETAFLDSLGDYADNATISLNWTCSDADVVKLEINAQHPTLLPDFAAGLAGLATLERTIETRVEARR